CLPEKVPEMGLHSGFGNSKHLPHFRDRADLNDGKEDAKLGESQSKLLGNRLRGRWQIQLRFPDEDRCCRGVRSASLASRSRGEGQDMGHVALLARALSGTAMPFLPSTASPRTVAEKLSSNAWSACASTAPSLPLGARRAVPSEIMLWPVALA